MTQLSATQAAKLYGFSTHKITRAIKAGELSAERQGAGYAIQIVELIRVYGEARGCDASQNVQETSHPASQVVSDERALPSSLDQWQGRYEELKATSTREREQMKDTIDDLRTRLDSAEVERRATQARLEDIRDRGGFFRIFRRRRDEKSGKSL